MICINHIFFPCHGAVGLFSGPQQNQTTRTLVDDASAAVKHAMHELREGLATRGHNRNDSFPLRSTVSLGQEGRTTNTGTGHDALAAATREVKAAAEAGALWRRDYQTQIKRAQQLVARREHLSWMQASINAWYVTCDWMLFDDDCTSFGSGGGEGTA
jgi:hypothetical protein